MLLCFGHAASGDVSRWKPPEVLQIQSESRWKMPADVRSQVLERDGERCWYCGENTPMEQTL